MKLIYKFLDEMQYCINAYEGVHGEVNWNGCEKVKRFDFTNFEGYTFEKQDEPENLYIAVRGSNSKNKDEKCGDWKYNFDIKMINATLVYPNLTPEQQAEIKISEGFGTIYSMGQEYILQAAQGYKNIILCGHSAGGPTSALGALDLKLKYPYKNIEHYSFGSPNVGNDYFKLLFNCLIKSYRIIYKNDFFSRWPRITYESVGEEINIGKYNIFDYIVYPFGSIGDHYPQKYLKALQKRQIDKKYL